MNNKEWLEWRRKGIGASDAPVIMGVSPYKTPYQLWEEKVFGTSQEETGAMKRGKDLEGQAILSFESSFGVLLEQQKMLTHEMYKWMLCTLDGYDEASKIAVEIKCPNGGDHLVALDGKVPEKYYPQIQHQLEVTGFNSMYYYSFDGKGGVAVLVERNEEYIEEMIEKELEFYNSVVNLTPPNLSEKDWINMESDTNWKEISEQYRQVKAVIADLEEKEEFLRSQFILFANGRNAKGYGVKLTKSMQKGAVDYKNIPQLWEVNLENYRKPSFPKYTIKVD